MENSLQPGIVSSIRRYWRDRASRKGTAVATLELCRAVWEFVRDSTPERLRQRFGDADYDWDFRVNTTSGAVGWRDRLLGTLNSPYQPTDPALFHEMLTAVQQRVGLNFAQFTFVDLGSGKGRTLLMASDYPFRRIVGVEFLPALHQIAQQNLAQYKSDSQRCFALEAICADATNFLFPDEPLIVYLFNPFPESGLRRVMASLAESLRQQPRPIYVLYHNPQMEHVVVETTSLKQLEGTHQYSIFGASL